MEKGVGGEVECGRVVGEQGEVLEEEVGVLEVGEGVEGEDEQGGVWEGSIDRVGGGAEGVGGLGGRGGLGVVGGDRGPGVRGWGRWVWVVEVVGEEKDDLRIIQGEEVGGAEEEGEIGGIEVGGGVGVGEGASWCLVVGCGARGGESGGGDGGGVVEGVVVCGQC